MPLSVLPLLVGSFWAVARTSGAPEHPGRPLCLRVESDVAGVRLTFLHRPRGRRTDALALYWGVWTEDGRVVDCAVTGDPAVTHRYLSMCRTWRAAEVSPAGYDVSWLVAPGGPCKRLDVGRRGDTLVRTLGAGGGGRAKRSWVAPGTLWCGTGSAARHYGELGMFEHVDRCCRDHDHCNHTIPAFAVNFGVFNGNLFTISHCDCDRRFRECLFNVNETISHMVGYTFFNILKLPCFEFSQKQYCTKLNWWGMCTETQMVPHAIFQTPTAYNILQVGMRNRDQSVSTVKPSAVHTTKQRGRKKLGISHQDCIAMDLVREDKVQPRKRTLCKKAGTAFLKRANISLTLTTILPQTANILPPTAMPALITDGKSKGVPEKASKIQTIHKKHESISKKLNSTIEKLGVNSKNGNSTWKNTSLSYTVKPSSYTCRQQKLHNTQTEDSKTRKSKGQLKKDCSIHSPKLKTIKEGLRPTKLMKHLSKKARRLTTITSAVKSSILSQIPVAPPKDKAPSVQSPTESTISHRTRTTTVSSDKRSRPQRPSSGQTSIPVMSTEMHLKYLDDCKYKILPFEKKYGYRNMESKTVYHCDCQRRCSASVFNVTDLELALRKNKLWQGTTVMKKTSASQRKRAPILLYKRCIKIASKE
uniref:phospholipase A2 n=1 Tax=Denticeps clupeoides TaxID=299321 RepID=A0AAY3ZUI0_9TELE